MIGLWGPHRSGKTTLAREVAKRLDWHFIETNTSGVFEELGLDPAQDLPFPHRLAVQNVILKRLSEAYMSAPHGEPWISDRTPLDVLSYTWAEVGRNSVPAELQPAFHQHIVRAYETTNMHFVQVWNVQPGIELVAAPGKAACNVAHIEHFNMLFHAIASNPLNNVGCYRIPRDMTELNLRVDLLISTIADTVSDTSSRKYAA